MCVDVYKHTQLNVCGQVYTVECYVDKYTHTYLSSMYGCENTVQECSHVKRFRSTFRKLQDSKTRSCDLSFFTDLFLEYVFTTLPGIVDRNECTLDYSLQLTIVVYAPLWKHGFATWLASVIAHLTQLTLLNLLSIN